MPDSEPPVVRASSRTRVLVLSAFLVLYGNCTALLVGSATPVTGWPGAFLGVLLILLTLAWAFRVAYFTSTDIGLNGRGMLGSAGIGLLVAVATGVAALLFLRFPPLVSGPVVYAPVAGLTPVGLFTRVAVWMPLDTVLPEELAFRGVLLAELRRSTPELKAIVASAAVFTLWHVVIISRTLALTNLRTDPLLWGLGLAGASAGVFVGGVLFAVLRTRTGHLAASVLAHWGFNTVLLVGLAAE